MSPTKRNQAWFFFLRFLVLCFRGFLRIEWLLASCPKVAGALSFVKPSSLSGSRQRNQRVWPPSHTASCSSLKRRSCPRTRESINEFFHCQEARTKRRYGGWPIPSILIFFFLCLRCVESPLDPKLTSFYELFPPFHVKKNTRIAPVSRFQRHLQLGCSFVL